MRVIFCVHRVFILSPANSAGQRANLIFNVTARFDLARRLHRGEKLALGEIFSFLSGLYFRGKFTYAQFFGRPPRDVHSAYVITSNRGLLPATELMSLADLRAFGEVPIDPGNLRYSQPLVRTAKKVARIIGETTEVVLLGSIGTNKYADLLTNAFAERLLFPADFVGRGDMSRGGLLLRSVSENRELHYIPVLGAVRRGKRPNRLAPRSWGYKICEGTTPPPAPNVRDST